MNTYRAALLMALMYASAHVETLPAKGIVDPRIRTALYNPDEVYRLYGFVSYDIELIFENGEVYTGKGGGDLDALHIEAHENHVHIKPKVEMVATNLVVYTNRRAYRFDYTASNEAPQRHSYRTIYAVRFLYPPMLKAAAENRAHEQVAASLAEAHQLRQRNVDYWYCGRHSIKPTAAWDDGVHTRLSFSPRTELPAVFVRNDDGSESLLNFHVEEGAVVIHRVAREFILRRGRTAGCVVNKGYDGSGERLESGTVSPNVQRALKEVRP